MEAVEAALSDLEQRSMINRRPDPGHPQDEAVPETPWGLPSLLSR
jgi:hypothetical protein